MRTRITPGFSGAAILLIWLCYISPTLFQKGALLASPALVIVQPTRQCTHPCWRLDRQ